MNPATTQVHNRAVQQYLSRYAEADIQRLTTFPEEHVFDAVIVIPCLREKPDFVRRLQRTPFARAKILVIVVVNQASSEPEPLNEALLAFFTSFKRLWQNEHLSFWDAPTAESTSTHIRWLLVDRTTLDRLLPVDQGVGLARKIGCDLAIALAARGTITSPWIHSSDADAHWPADYLSLPSANYCAAVYAFEHIRADATEQEWQATQQYEQALCYYVAGLAWAGSPYAQHTIGSVLAFTVNAYCQVRGFPKRSAGEDFYILNKLTKLGAVYRARSLIQIEARSSNRVPFGTGPNVQKIAAMSDPLNDYVYYAPGIFVELKNWLDSVPNIWSALLNQEDPLAGLSEALRDALIEARIEALWPHLRTQAKDDSACQKALHIWFDAFQTLKLIRRLQASAYPPVPLQQCLRDAPFRCSI
jgi:hypothetical protein